MSQMVAVSLCLLLAVGHHTQAKPMTYKGVSYKLPKGWEAKEGEGVQFLIPSKEVPGNVLAVILTQAIPKDSKPWSEAFKNFLEGAEKETTVLSRSETQTTKQGNLEVFVQTQHLKNADLGEYDALYELIGDAKNAAAICVITKGEELLKQFGNDLSELVQSVAPVASTPEPPKNTGAKKIRTGDTPGLYPGTPGWLPSGRGTEIPKARLVDGKPTGMWMNPGFDLNSRSVMFATIYLPNGTMVRYPRFGGGNLIDIEGELANPNDVKSVGTWSVGNGTMTTKISGGTSTYKYSTGKDAEGEFFMFGGAKYRPCIPVTPDYLVGNWHIVGAGEYDFAKDGTIKYSYAFTRSDAEKTSGTYVLDGYLFAIEQPKAYIVDRIFRFGTDGIVVGQRIYSRKK